MPDKRVQDCLALVEVYTLLGAVPIYFKVSFPKLS